MMDRQLIVGVAFLIGVLITGPVLLKYKADKRNRRRIYERTKALTREHGEV